jgi:hypothetical protein
VLTRVIKPFTTIGALAALIFAVVALGLFRLHGSRLVFNNDEGIILDAALRMTHGETLYRDFFGYMSSGSYWLQEAAFRLFGVSLQAGRLVVIIDFAVECAFLFWLTARLAGRGPGFAAAALFIAFQATTPDLLLSQHRMDSAALSLLSIAFCLLGRSRQAAWCWVAAGILIAGAAACTPAIALLTLPTGIWLSVDRPLRRFLIPYSCGLCAASLAIAAALAATGSLSLFLNQMAWLRRNYSGVNVMSYGSMMGGYVSALTPVAGTNRVVQSLTVFFFALPAVLPVAALALWSLCFLCRPGERQWATENGIPYLLACMVAYIASTYPRADLAHLAFVEALPAALTAVWIVRYSPRRLNAAGLAFLAFWGGCFLAQTAIGLREEVAVVTPVGTLRAAPSGAQALAALLTIVHPGDALYVHPYQPLLYFLTQGRNPTRYSYLSPGMMTRYEETAALESLESAPPRWLLYHPLSRGEFLRVFPNAAGLDHRFPMIEAWCEREYVAVEPPVIVTGYRLYERRAIPARITIAAQ